MLNLESTIFKLDHRTLQENKTLIKEESIIVFFRFTDVKLKVYVEQILPVTYKKCYHIQPTEYRCCLILLLKVKRD